MAGLVSILSIITCVLQATNCYIVSVNGQARNNSTDPSILNHVDEKPTLQYTQGLNSTTAVISNFQDFLTSILSEDVDVESHNASEYNVTGLRHTRATTRGRSFKRATTRDRSLTRSTTQQNKNYIDCQGQRKTRRCRTQWKCSGKRMGRRSNTRSGGSTRLKGRRNRRMKTSNCPTVNTAQWGRWSAWSSCSRSCGEGARRRTRTCIDTDPANGGSSCSGVDTQTDYCNTKSCGMNSK